MGQNPSDADILTITNTLSSQEKSSNPSEVVAGTGPTNSSSPTSNSTLNDTLDFTQFIKAIQLQREIEKKSDHHQDFVEAFIAMVQKISRSTNIEMISLFVFFFVIFSKCSLFIFQYYFLFRVVILI
jgi:hypothetical protein